MPPFGVDGWRRVAPKPAPCCGIDPLKRMLRSIALVSAKMPATFRAVNL